MSRLGPRGQALLQLLNLPHAIAAALRARSRRRPIDDRVRDGRVDRDRVLLKLLVGAWSDILGRRPLLLLGAIVFATLPFTYLGVSTLAYITDATPRTRYGAAHGAFGTIYDIGDAAGPIAAGLLVATSGYGAMFQMMGGAGLTMAAVFLLTSQSRPGGGPSA